MSASGRIYLDYNATTPLIEPAREAMLPLLGGPANASSVHSEGRAARHAVERARGQVAALAGGDPKNVIFTSGASEANTMALAPVLRLGSDDAEIARLFVTAAGHPSLLQAGRFPSHRVETIPVDRDGLVERQWLRGRLAAVAGRGERALVALMLANNETGVIENVGDVAETVREFGHFLHVDAVQAAGRMPVRIDELGADSLSLSAHKIGGPLGAGALVMADEGYRPLPLIVGGGQEQRQRAGTENTPAIAGFGAAAEYAHRTAADGIRKFAERDFLEVEFRTMFRTVIIFGELASRIGNTSCFALPGVPADTLMMSLDLDGIAVSSGSACSSGKVGVSHVLLAMGIEPELAKGAVRVSVGERTSRPEIERFLAALRKAVGRVNESVVSGTTA